MPEKVDLSPLFGRRFASSSDNICCLVKIENTDEIRAEWKRRPTYQDMKEVEEFINGVMGCKFDFYESTGKENEEKELKKYRSL